MRFLNMEKYFMIFFSRFNSELDFGVRMMKGIEDWGGIGLLKISERVLASSVVIFSILIGAITVGKLITAIQNHNTKR